MLRQSVSDNCCGSNMSDNIYKCPLRINVAIHAKKAEIAYEYEQLHATMLACESDKKAYRDIAAGLCKSYRRLAALQTSSEDPTTRMIQETANEIAKETQNVMYKYLPCDIANIFTVRKD